MKSAWRNRSLLNLHPWRQRPLDVVERRVDLLASARACCAGLLLDAEDDRGLARCASLRRA